MRSGFSVLAVAALVSMAGCTTAPPRFERPIDGSRIIGRPTVTHQLPSTLKVVRDGGFYGGGVDLLITLNGQKLALLGQSESVSVLVDPGEHQLAVVTDTALTLYKPMESDFVAKPGQVLLFRVGLEAMHRPVLRRDRAGESSP